MTDWRRHPADTKFHVGAESGGSFATLCRGRWPLAEQEGVVFDANPPHEDRCEACQRVRIEQRRIEQGLAELVDATDRGGDS